MMAQDSDLGAGAPGVPQGGQLQSDLTALSDPAKKAAAVAATRQAAVQANAGQNLQRVQQGQPTKSLGDMIADHVMSQTDPDPDQEPHRYLTYAASRIADLMKEQGTAKKLKNQKAVQSYDQVIGILQQRMKGVQDKLTARMTAAPAQGQVAAGGQVGTQ